MAKGRKRKSGNAARPGGEAPTPEQLATGEFERRSIGHAEGVQTTSQAYVRHQSRSALAYMHSQGSLTDDQYYSAQQIAEIAEKIERSVASRCASMEARVDCSGSGRDALVESLRLVRAEAAYSTWRAMLPIPRRMVIDMVTRDTGLAKIAASHNMSWRRARDVLKTMLDAWPPIYQRHCREIGPEDLNRRHAALNNS